jgi:hypothetical protein
MGDGGERGDDVAAEAKRRTEMVQRMQRDADYLEWKYSGGGGARASAFTGALLGSLVALLFWTYPVYAVAAAFSRLTLLPDTATELAVLGLIMLVGVPGAVKMAWRQAQ